MISLHVPSPAPTRLLDLCPHFHFSSHQCDVRVLQQLSLLTYPLQVSLAVLWYYPSLYVIVYTPGVMAHLCILGGAV